MPVPCNLVIDQAIKESFKISSSPNELYGKGKAVSSEYNRIFLVQSGTGSLWIDNEECMLAWHELLLVSKMQLFSSSDAAAWGWT